MSQNRSRIFLNLSWVYNSSITLQTRFTFSVLYYNSSITLQTRFTFSVSYYNSYITLQLRFIVMFYLFSVNRITPCITSSSCSSRILRQYSPSRDRVRVMLLFSQPGQGTCYVIIVLMSLAYSSLFKFLWVEIIFALSLFVNIPLFLENL